MQLLIATSRQRKRSGLVLRLPDPLGGAPFGAFDNGAAAVQAASIQRAVGRQTVEQQRIAFERLHGNALQKHKTKARRAESVAAPRQAQCRVPVLALVAAPRSWGMQLAGSCGVCCSSTVAAHQRRRWCAALKAPAHLPPCFAQPKGQHKHQRSFSTHLLAARRQPRVFRPRLAVWEHRLAPFLHRTQVHQHLRE